MEPGLLGSSLRGPRKGLMKQKNDSAAAGKYKYEKLSLLFDRGV